MIKKQLLESTCKLYALFFVISICGVFCSCATHNGYLSSNAVLVDNNFRIIGIGIGEAESIRILGFGGLKKNALVYDAKNDLYNKVELKQGQALTNITVDFKRENFILYSKTKVTVSGEIVDFNKSNDSLTQNFYGLKERKGYELGEQVYVMFNGKYVLKKIKVLDLDEIQLESENNELLTYKFDYSYRLFGSFHYKERKYSIGDDIEIILESNTHSGNESFKGEVIGVSTKNALLRGITKNEFKVIKIDNE